MYLALIRNVFLGLLGIFVGAIMLLSFRDWIKGMATDQGKLVIAHGMMLAIIILFSDMLDGFMVFRSSMFISFILTLVLDLINYAKSKKSNESN